MARHNLLWLALGLLLLACEVGDGDFDGGLFDDDDAGAFVDESPGDDPPEPLDDAGVDAAVTEPMDDDDGGIEPGDGDGDTDPDPISPQTWPSLLADAVCTALEDCMGPELLADAFRGRDCRNLRTGELQNGDLEFLSDSVAADRVTFVREQVDTCLSDVVSLGCQVESARLPVSCQLALIGNVALDGECAINEDCGGEAFCDKGETPTCPAFCAPRVGAGETCTSDDDGQCEDGLICSGTNEDDVGSCEALGELADPCGSGVGGCRPGLICLDDGIETTCETLDTIYFLEDGDDCELDVALCETGLVCESTGVGAEGVCAPTVAEGEACKRADPNQCPFHQYCDADTPGTEGVCRDRPTDGMPCLTRAAACADEHRCVNDICVLRKHNDESCDTDEECYSEICEAGACTAPLMCSP